MIPKKKAKATEARVRPTFKLTLPDLATSFSELTAFSDKTRCSFYLLTVGGVSNVWKGAGEGTVHSNPPSFASHGLALAFSPPFIHFIIQYKNTS